MGTGSFFWSISNQYFPKPKGTGFDLQEYHKLMSAARKRDSLVEDLFVENV